MGTQHHIVKVVTYEALHGQAPANTGQLEYGLLFARGGA